MNPKTVSELVSKAIDLVKDTPESYRIPTFSVVLNRLMSERVGESTQSRGTSEITRVQDFDDRNELIGYVLDATLDFSSYEHVIDTSTWVEKAMIVLAVVQNQFGIKALTPSEIARVMTEQMRLSTVYPSNISRDLSETRKFFLRSKEGRGYKYSLTRAARKHLDELSQPSG